MRQIKLAAAMAAAMMALAAAPSAEAQTGVAFGIGPSVAVPTGDFGEFAKMGIGGGAGIVIRPNGSQLGVRATVGYHQFSEDGGADGAPKATNVTPMAGLTYSLTSSGSVTPYVHGSAGLMMQSYDGDSESAFGFGGGAGLVFGTGSTRVFVEAAYVTASKDGGTTSYMPVTAGVTLRLK